MSMMINDVHEHENFKNASDVGDEERQLVKKSNSRSKMSETFLNESNHQVENFGLENVETEER
jgi:hypothetical protein